MTKDIYYRLFKNNQRTSFEIVFNNDPINCCIVIRRNGDNLQIKSKNLILLRNQILSKNNSSNIYFLLNKTISYLKKNIYLFFRALNKFFPGIILDRRMPIKGGLLIALIAPDIKYSHCNIFYEEILNNANHYYNLHNLHTRPSGLQNSTPRLTSCQLILCH